MVPTFCLTIAIGCARDLATVLREATQRSQNHYWIIV
jgi:hypothetical protein